MNRADLKLKNIFLHLAYNIRYLRENKLMKRNGVFPLKINANCSKKGYNVRLFASIVKILKHIVPAEQGRWEKIRNQPKYDFRIKHTLDVTNDNETNPIIKAIRLEQLLKRANFPASLENIIGGIEGAGCDFRINNVNFRRGQSLWSQR